MIADDSRPAYVSSADLADSFDAFYKDARDRLLLQTFALTGDLTVARSAVREAFVVAWHHWRKTSRLEDPEMAVRPVAWRKALRRSSTRPWGRKKDLGEETRAILDALSSLPVTQRKALLLTQLAAVTMDEMARELGLPQESAERELQLGAAQFAMQLHVPTSAIPLALSSLSDVTRSATWPRVTIIRRAGAARRRAHTVVGGAAAVVALVAGGATATDVNGSRPTLDRQDVPVVSAPAPAGPAVTVLPDTALLSLDSVQQGLATRGWRQGATNDNSSGDGRVLPCQTDRYADPKGRAAWVRVFRKGPPRRPSRALLQFAEASAGEARAERTYRRTLRWFATCPPAGGAAAAAPEIQLVSTANVRGVGDQSTVFVLRSITARRTYVVGVARTGLFTTSVALTTDVPAAQANRAGIARVLATAVERMCALPDGGGCAVDRPRPVDRSAYPVGTVPWMLSSIDLPPVGADHGPWVGTPAAQLREDRVDAGAIGCATVHLFRQFQGRRIQGNQFRSFLLSEGRLPPEVGLTQTVGALPAPAAKAFVRRIRQQIAACPDQDASAGTEVRELARGDTRATSLSVWSLTTALPGDRSVAYHLGVARRGTSISLVVYVAAPRARIADADFVAVARRSLERLERMQPYDRG